MSQDAPFFERIKRARAAQVGVLYLGASWVVLQLVDTLTNILGLPGWLGRVTVVLLGVGFVVVLATAFVQSLESTTRAEQAGEVPTDWEVDPADALASLKAGRLPHLTWGRAAVGGVVTLSLVIGAAGAFVLLGGGRSLIAPPSAGVEEAAEAIAVLPFVADGADIEFMREGMVNLVSATLDGVGDFRTIDSRTVLARWDEEVSADSRPDLESMLRVAGRTGARYAVLGSVVPAGQRLRVNVDLYDIRDGSKVGDVQSEGTAEGILELVDRLTVEMATALLGVAGADEATTRTLASITTASPEALKVYLEGESLHREGELEAAAERFEEAVAVDSTFALAWMRLNDAVGWLFDPSGRARAAMDQARRFRERLSRRRDELLTARSSGRAVGIPLLQEYVRRYPDDAEAWHRLGDYALHLISNEQRAPEFSTEAMVEALERAVEIDPGFAPYRLHIVDFAFLNGDSLAARQAIDAYWENGGAPNPYSTSWDAGFRLFFGLESGVATAVADAAEGFPRLALGVVAAEAGADLRTRDFALRRAIVGQPPTSLTPWLLAAGRLDEWRASLMEDVDGLSNTSNFFSDMSKLSLQMSTFLARQQFGVVGLDPDPRHRDVPSECDDPVACMQETVASLLHGTVDGHRSEYEEALRAWDARSSDYIRAAAAPSGPLDTAFFRAFIESFRGWGELGTGEPEAAIARWQGSPDGIAVGRVFGMGVAYEAIEELERAEQHYRAALYTAERPFASYRLGRLYERLGRTDEALVEYRRLEVIWADADFDFPPWVETRAALTRLAG